MIMTMIMLSEAEGDVDSSLFDDIPPHLCKAGLQGALIRSVLPQIVFFFNYSNS